MPVSVDPSDESCPVAASDPLESSPAPMLSDETSPVPAGGVIEPSTCVLLPSPQQPETLFESAVELCDIENESSPSPQSPPLESDLPSVEASSHDNDPVSLPAPATTDEFTPSSSDSITDVDLFLLESPLLSVKLLELTMLDSASAPLSTEEVLHLREEEEEGLCLPIAESTTVETPFQSSSPVAVPSEFPPPVLLPVDVMSISSSSSSIEADSLTGIPSRRGSDKMERDSLEGDEQQDDYVHVELCEREVKTPEDFFQEADGGRETAQLWRTVILEESEPNSKNESGPASLERTVDSGIVKDGPGPITQAVSLWLESAPIHQQLITSTASILEDVDESDEEEEEDASPVPKNELLNPCTAPSSERSVTDGPQLRVGSATTITTLATGRDCSEEEEEEPLCQPLACDPAKFSVYYQLGVTVEEDEEEGLVVDDTIKQCPPNDDFAPTATLVTGKNKERPKRNSWRRILVAHRAVHKNDAKTKRLKSGQSCCAMQ